MKKLPLSAQIAIGPLIIVLILSALITFTLNQLGQIHEQNEVVRRWGRITDRLHTAIAAGQRMQDLTGRIEAKSPDDDLHFMYLEQSQLFVRNIAYPECVEQMPQATLKQINAMTDIVRYDENMDFSLSRKTFTTLLPTLETLYDTWWAQKRSAYIDYYDNLQVINARLVTVSLTSLFACALLAALLSLWTIFSIKNRLRRLSNATSAVCDGNITSIPIPNNNRDELDQLANCVSRMTDKLLNVIAVEKVVEGSEIERKRIAMDMHDQVLSDLTGITHDIDSLQQQSGGYDSDKPTLHAINENLGTVINNIRNIIDDLHPHLIDVLGLVPALESYIHKYASGAGLPSVYMSLDKTIEKILNPFQKISLYRIALEAINNVIHHAQCSQYEVSLRKLENTLILSVEDNGVGLPTHDTEIDSHHGLVNIRERAHTLGASVDWRTARFSSGTLFECRMPLSY